jgi:putative transposase
MSRTWSRPAALGSRGTGSTPKTLITEQGACGSMRPGTVRARLSRRSSESASGAFEGLDEEILALYSRGLSTRDIKAHFAEIYGVKVGRDLISKVTDAVMDDARNWQTRPLYGVYPVVFLDALVLKIRDGGSVQRRACYLALAASVKCSACGSRPTRGPSSGCRSSPI